MKNSLMWFRYDLRVNDNDAFFEASQNQNCLPVFILDEGYLNLKTTSDFHLNFLNDSLHVFKILGSNFSNSLRNVEALNKKIPLFHK